MNIPMLVHIGLLCMFRIQENNSIMCRYFCIGFIDLMLAGKTLNDYTSLFSC